jgi:hypothetical protein
MHLIVRDRPFESLSFPSVQYLWPGAGLGMGDAMVEAAMQTRSSGARTVVLMGDVYWTHRAISSLLNSGSFVTVSTDDVDTFGLSFDSETIPTFSESLRVGGNTNRIRAELTKLLGADGWGKHLVDDWTQDFDIDWEHTQFMAGLSKNNHFRRTPAQVKLRRALGMRVPRRKK